MRKATFNKVYSCIFFCISLFVGCNLRDKKINIFLENSSNIRKNISVSILIDNRFYQKVIIPNDFPQVHYKIFEINFPYDKDSINLEFKLNNTGEIASSTVYKDSINQAPTVHVNLSEMVFLKGFQISSKILTKDSVASRKFYSEVMY
jgi:hypothetical protein